MASKYIERKRISEKMKNIEKYPLSIIHAPMGYGKTVAVKEYLKTAKVDYVWVPLGGSDGEAQYLWAKLCDALEQVSMELSEKLKNIGFPYDCFKSEAVLDVWMDHEYKNDLILVFDDFQTIDDNYVFEMFKTIVRERIGKLHFVIITRELAKLDAADLYQRQLCFTITEKSLKFNKEETFQYIQFMVDNMKEKDKEQIYQITDGWESMLYIVMKGVQRGLPIGKMATIDDIIEQNFYQGLNPEAKEVLSKISVLPTFSKLMVAAVLNDKKLFEAFENLISKNLFFIFNEFENTYRIRNILQGFVYEKAVIAKIDFRDIYKRSGEWMLEQKQYSKALEYLLKAKEAESIFSILNQDTLKLNTNFMNPNLYQAFEKAPKELLYKYPIAYLRYLLTYATDLNNNALVKIEGQLDQMEDYIKKADCKEEVRNSVLGEIYIVRSRISYNNRESTVTNAEIASKYLQGGCSCIVTKDTEFTYGMPHLTLSYFREAGELSDVLDFFVSQSGVLIESTGGCGIGCDSLAIAETALEMGAFEKAELYAYKAFYKAKSAEQLSIMLSSKFVLDRLNVLQGNDEDKNMLTKVLKDEVIRANNPVLNTTFDLCNAYINACIGRLENIPEWIKNGEISKGNFLSQGVGYYFIVHGKCLLLNKKYIELDSLCESVDNLTKPFHYHLVKIYVAIYESITKSYLESRATGEAILNKALEAAKVDHIIMPFAENAVHIKIMLKSLLNRKEDEFLLQVYDCCNNYSAQLKLLNSCMVTLTDREIEILKFLDEGNTHEEIAKELFISIATVRYHIKNIYQKMNVNNKILALRKAKELNLI
ncbi:helix-turn-helix transcriptional regulator [Anaerocolumna aminovalerica]|uniref:helix-turn-helix transcriptional regulator n=1 Tax=Anaerocolumna aminovalerica TaxID=1527 RepID=UPI000BE379EA|nr:LuxR C-terminal-related transcriptional regulator [Anaerocolumna aminovalerica]